jgi:hypothetical protein
VSSYALTHDFEELCENVANNSFKLKQERFLAPYIYAEAFMKHFSFCLQFRLKCIDNIVITIYCYGRESV